MMFIIIVLYDICWLPIKLYQYLLNYDLISYCTEAQFYALIYCYIACHWLAMANSFANPIVYSFMSKSFRVSEIIGYFSGNFLENVESLLKGYFLFEQCHYFFPKNTRKLILFLNYLKNLQNDFRHILTKYVSMKSCTRSTQQPICKCSHHACNSIQL